MPFGRTSGSHERIEANNCVRIPDGTREFQIVDVWLYSVVEKTAVSDRTGQEYTKRKYTAEITNDQDCQIKLSLVKRPDIVISDTLRVYLGQKSKFAKLVEALIGVAPGTDLEKYLMAGKSELDTKATSKELRESLVGTHVLCSTKYNEETGYVRVSSYTAKPEEDDDLGGIPPQEKQRQTTASTASQSGFEEEIEDEIPF